jgi:septal ring factor EnvC (AmiA/AmiB activator)|tara:strand:+ start:581 stop:808 length:228 start_codon:yes stop_codon:yes gene_type:complete
MAITLETLHEEKTLLQKDFDEQKRNITKIEMDLVQMKANLNALNGAIQQTVRLINKIEVEGEKKSKALKEMVAKG